MIQRLNAIIQEKVNPSDLVYMTDGQLKEEAEKMASRIHERAAYNKRMLDAVENDTVVEVVFSEVARSLA